MACYKCWDNSDMLCVVKDDVINECIARMAAADGIILASPTYFADVTAEMKALIDRAGMVGRANNDLFRRKVGARWWPSAVAEPSTPSTPSTTSSSSPR
jgi:multimeric flavodoxin WrbA